MVLFAIFKGFGDMGTRTRIGIWVGATVVLSVLAWEIGPFLARDDFAQLDEVVAVEEEVQQEEVKEVQDSPVEVDRQDEEVAEFQEHQEDVVDQIQEVQDHVVQEVAVVEAAPASFGGGEPSGGGMPMWQSIWADLNLTPEEEARLRDGFSIAISRYMSMSPQAQAAERERMAQMRQRWEGMGDEEREATSQRLRDRFEDWRASGRVELPELSLD